MPLNAREEAEAELSREISNFLDELKETFDDDLVDEKIQRIAWKKTCNSDSERKQRIQELLQEMEV